MREVVINCAKDKVLNSFQFIESFGYSKEYLGITDDDRFEIRFRNNIIKKVIKFTISDNENVRRFHITISIIKHPYLSVNDFIDFDIYLMKNNISFKNFLEGNEINEKAIDEYISNYSDLFKEYGIELISTNMQFPDYFPKWN